MHDNTFMNMITAYKKSVLFFSAFKSGLFEWLADEPKSTTELCNLSGIDSVILFPWLQILEDMGVVMREEDKWYENPKLGLEKKRNIINHEYMNYKKYNTPESLLENMMLGAGKRAFDICGFTDEEYERYCKAMYGENLRQTAILLYRELRKKKVEEYLEYGRSMGYLSVHLQKWFKNMNVDIVTEQRLIEKVQEGKMYHIITMNNTVHYLNDIQMRALLSDFRKVMEIGSVLCIIDIFLKDGNWNYGVFVDWVTHGGDRKSVV